MVDDVGIGELEVEETLLAGLRSQMRCKKVLPLPNPQEVLRHLRGTYRHAMEPADQGEPCQYAYPPGPGPWETGPSQGLLVVRMVTDVV